MKIENKIILVFFVSILISVIFGFIISSNFTKVIIPLVLLLVFILAVGVAKILAYYILTQLQALHQTILEILQGNLNHRVIVRSHDQIGDLCRDFNEMITRLSDAYQGLEKKVRERTSEITILKTSLEERVKERTAELENLKTGLEKKVEERTKELNEKLEVLEKLNKVMINRELRMIELKKEIKDLKSQTATGQS